MKPGKQQSKSVAERADAIFLAVLEIESPEEQQAYVEEACANDPDVRTEVDRLLAAMEDSKVFFERGPVTQITAAEISRTLTEIPGFFENLKTVLPDDEEVGKQIGPYKLLQKIGEGGVGNVYLAEQEKPVRRRIAFKIIKRGMDTKSVMARFEIERQALAMMEHPNIARVIDAGETETGRPFFVMELVHGIRITTYCEENSLNVRERLKLLIQVCHGIQHAHQKGIIHRDIKPSNVLVSIHDGRPLPKVIDFGIAKAASDDAVDGGGDYTRVEPFIGTPAYMSPEQAQSGVDVDTRSDIYSLGIMLYELLTGAPPFSQKELMKTGHDGMRRMLLEGDPLRPSVRLIRLDDAKRDEVARKRATDARHLHAMLQGDLDWVVMKALEKDRTRRYETVDAFAMDLERFLNNKPVLARPPSRGYRFRKMVHRNKGAFVAGTTIGLILMAWLATSSWLFMKERDARKRAVVAERQQTQLRMAAEDRERIAQAAFLISQGKIEAADRFVEKVAFVTPSLEAESVLRTLGEWHALKGQWSESADRFRLLLKADLKDNSWTITDDLLKAGPVLIEQGDVQGYEGFRRVAIAMYQNTEEYVFAERTLKISILLPVDQSTLNSLQSIEDQVAKTCQGVTVFDAMRAWGAMSLALMEYRKGEWTAAIEWCERCRNCVEQHPVRIAISHLIQSMASSAQGNVAEARAHFLQGRLLVEAVFSKPLEIGTMEDGFWYDWIYARILMREAQSWCSRNGAIPLSTNSKHREIRSPDIFSKNGGSCPPMAFYYQRGYFACFLTPPALPRQMDGNASMLLRHKCHIGKV